MVIAQRVNGEAVVVLGWGRAILMQVAHPLVAAAIAQHSDFEAGAVAYVRRMRRTIAAMLSLTFGTEPEVRRAAAQINAIHARVHGRLPETVGPFSAGTRYSAADPALLTWVHTTLVDSQLRTHRLFVGTLTTDEEDQYCAEAAAVGPLLNVRAAALPQTVAAVAGYLDDMHTSGKLVVTDTARALAVALLAPPGGRLVGPAMALGRLTTTGLLPEELRHAYRLPWSDRRERALRHAGLVLRRVRRLVPPGLREWPAARRARVRQRLEG